MDTSKEYQIAYDAYLSAAEEWAGQIANHAKRAHDYAVGLGYEPKRPERRVVQLTRQASWRVDPKAHAVQTFPFQYKIGGDDAAWVVSRYTREDALPNTILGDLLAYPNVGDVPPTLPPLPAITEDTRGVLESLASAARGGWAPPECKELFAYALKHCPRADGAA